MSELSSADTLNDWAALYWAEMLTGPAVKFWTTGTVAVET